MNNVQIEAVNIFSPFKNFGDGRESEFKGKVEVEGRFLKCRGTYFWKNRSHQENRMQEKEGVIDEKSCKRRVCNRSWTGIEVWSVFVRESNVRKQKEKA